MPTTQTDYARRVQRAQRHGTYPAGGMKARVINVVRQWIAKIGGFEKTNILADNAG